MWNFVINLFSKKTNINCYSNLQDPILKTYYFEFDNNKLDEWIIFIFEEINKIKNDLNININQIIFSIKNISSFKENSLIKIKTVFQDAFNTKIKLIDYFELVAYSSKIEEGYIVYFGFETSFTKISNYKNIKNINLKNNKLDYLTYEYIRKKLINYFFQVESKNNSNLYFKFKSDFNINSIKELEVNDQKIIEWLLSQTQIVQEKFIIGEIKKVLIPIVKYAEKKVTNVYVICDFDNNELILKILKRYFLSKDKCIFLV